jgi:branched-chain amino acid transport system substrate-binding protein
MQFHGGWCARFTSLLCVLTLSGAGLAFSAGSAGAAQPSGTPIKIGVLETNAGPGDINEGNALDATAKYINAHGGVGGHPIQLTTDLESNDVAVSVANAQKFISQGYDAIVDADANDSAWASAVEAAGIPVLLSADTLAFGSSDDAFGSPQTPTVTTPLEMIAINKVGGASKIAVMYCTEYSQCSQAVPYYTSLGKKYGDQVVYSAAASQSAPNYLAQCLAAKAAGANSLFPAASSDVAVRVVENCAKQGYTPHLLAGAGSYNKGFIGTPGTNGLIGTDHNVPFFDTSNPQIKIMTAAFNKYDPSLTKNNNYDDTAVWNWINGALLVQAAKAAHWTSKTRVTAASLKTALLALGTTTAGGLMAPLTFAAGKPEANNCAYTVEIKKNKFVLPYGLKATCLPASS